MAAGQGSAAAAEFQKILDHSGIVWNCWTGALAHLGVGRANALQSKTSQGADADAARVRALAAYKDFLTLWKDADPDIPILIAAKSEYAKLQVISTLKIVTPVRRIRMALGIISPRHSSLRSLTCLLPQPKMSGTCQARTRSSASPSPITASWKSSEAAVWALCTKPRTPAWTASSP